MSSRSFIPPIPRVKPAIIPKVPISWRAMVFPWTAFFGLLAVSYLVTFSPLFRLHKISCQFNSGPCPEPVVQYLDQFRRTPSLFLKPELIISRVYQLVSQADTVNVKVNLPQTILVTITSAPSLAAVKIAQLDAFFIIDQNFRVTTISPTLPDNLQVISVTYPVPITVGQVVTDQSLIFTFTILAALPQVNLVPAQTILESPDSLTLKSVSGSTIIFSPLQDASRQLTSLQSILAKATMKTSSPIIDVRFQKPVIRNNSNSDGN